MTTSQDTCPICGAGNLQPHTAKNSVEYKGNHTELDIQYSVCDSCESEQASMEQLLANKRAMVAFKKRVDGLLAGIDVRMSRKHLHISQAIASRIFGGGPVAFSKYERDDVMQSDAMNKLLQVAVAVPEAFTFLAHKAGIEPHTPSVAYTYVRADMPLTKPTSLHLRVIKNKVANEPEECWKKIAL